MAGDYAIVRRIDLSGYDRVIAVSDIHGDCAGFDGMLEFMGFGERDALVVVGDILERGSESLKLLKRVVSLSKTGRVYTLRGNNDVLLHRWCRGKIGDEQVLDYVRFRKHSLIADMVQELGMPFESLSDAAALKEAICVRYAEEIAFLEALPHILDSEIATFVHAGVMSGDLYTQSAKYCLTALEFSRQGYRFDKPVVVGHWPASSYSEEIINVGVHFNRESNIYSIDGGNSLKKCGQINILMFKRSEKAAFSSYDRLSKVRVLESQENSEEPLTLIFPKTLVEIREDLGEQKRCYVPHLQREMCFPANRIYEYKHKTYCSDFTTYRLPVKAGEVVSFCGEEDDGILVKRGGIVGKYVGKYEGID